MNCTRKAILFLFVISLALASCFSPYRGNSGNLVISLGRTSRVGFTEAEKESFSHTIRVSGGGGPEQILAGVRYGSLVSFTVAHGRWNIHVQAFDPDGRLKAEGSKMVTVGLGVNPVVSIEMFTSPLQAGLYWDNSGEWQPVNDPGINPSNSATYLEDVIRYLNNNSTDGNFRMVIDRNLSGGGLSMDATVIQGRSLSVTAWGGPHEIRLNSDSGLITIGENNTLTLNKNITLRGNPVGTGFPLVKVESGGTLIMEDESTITGHHNNDPLNGGGAVYVNGVFIMKGGTISENKAVTGGGVDTANGGKFTMNGGIISNNIAASNGGGIYVYASGNASFSKTGGVIYGKDETDPALKNSASTDGKGHAVFVYNGGSLNDKWMDNTVEREHKLNSGDNDNWNDSVPKLSGIITITPAGTITVGSTLTAAYIPAAGETGIILYEWFRDDISRGPASSTNTYKPTEAGRYTVKTRLEGYQSKTSAAVNVTAEAQIGNTQYGTLSNAFSAAPAGSNDNPTEIKLLSDITTTSAYAIVEDNAKNIRIDGNNKTITVAANFTYTGLFGIERGSLYLGGGSSGGTLTLNGNGIAKNAITIGTVDYGLYPGTTGRLYMYDGVTITGFGNDVSGTGGVLMYKGTFDMHGGVIAGNNGWGVCLSRDGTTLTMYGGTIYGSNETDPKKKNVSGAVGPGYSGIKKYGGAYLEEYGETMINPANTQPPGAP